MNQVDECLVTVERQIRRFQVVVFFMTLAVLLPAPLYPKYFTHQIGLTSTEYGEMIGASSLTHLIAAIVYGTLSDSLGRRKLVLFQTILSFTLYSLFAWLMAIGVHNDIQYPSPLGVILVAIFIILGLSSTINLLTCSAVCDLCMTNPHLASLRPKFLAQVAGVLGLAGVIGPPVGQLVEYYLTGESRPHIIMWLAALASLIALGVALGVTETKQSTNTDDSRSDSSFGRRANAPLLELASLEIRELATELPAVSSRDTSSGPSSTIHPQSLPDKSVLNLIIDDEHDTDLNKSQNDTLQNLFILYLCQSLKSFSLSAVAVCYPLVLEVMIPEGWLWGLSSIQVLALGLSTCCIVRTCIQMVYFQRIMILFGGPGETAIRGCIFMSSGFLFLYWTMKYLPGPLGLSDINTVNPWCATVFAIVHFAAVGGLLAAGLSLIEPAFTALIALATVDNRSLQGATQGFNSAFNLLGRTIGPPFFGWLLNYSIKDIKTLNPDIKTLPLVTERGAVPPPIILDDKQIDFVIPNDDIWNIDTQMETILSSSTNSRPAMVFYTAAISAAIPLLFARKLLRISKYWSLK